MLAGKSFKKHFSRQDFLDYIFLSLGFSLLLIGLVQYFGWGKKETPSLTVIRNDSEEASSIWVDISGAVEKPGVYQLPSNSRLNDLLVACGGPTRWASYSFVDRQLNRARFLEDGEKIYIPYVGEEGEEKEKGGDVLARGEKVNINTASAAELQSLPGIGPSFASRIISYRQDHQGFDNIEEIKNVAGIGEKTFLKIKDLIVVE